MYRSNSIGGIHRKKGQTEIQHAVWLASRPACAMINTLLQSFAGVELGYSQQHQDITKSRVKRDNDDLRNIVNFLEQSSPFDKDISNLKSISTGVSAANHCNAEESKVIGQRILKSMEGKSLAQFSFKKKDQAVLMTSKSSDQKNSSISRLETTLLFQRCISVLKRSEVDQQSTFCYELSSFPTSMFDEFDLLRSADKPELAKGIAKAVITNENCVVSTIKPLLTGTLKYYIISNSYILTGSLLVGCVMYVLDGGAFLHSVPWNKGETYSAIFDNYHKYLAKHFPGAIIVFDGYDDGPSTKDIAHIRRSKIVGREVEFSEQMQLTTGKEEFLSNVKN